MLPIAHVLARHYKNKQQVEHDKSVNRNPHVVPPRCGLYSSDENCAGHIIPFRCTDSDVLISMFHLKSKLRVALTFIAATSPFDVFIPLSEFGLVESLTVTLDGTILTGEVFRRNVVHGDKRSKRRVEGEVQNSTSTRNNNKTFTNSSTVASNVVVDGGTNSEEKEKWVGEDRRDIDLIPSSDARFFKEGDLSCEDDEDDKGSSGPNNDPSAFFEEALSRKGTTTRGEKKGPSSKKIKHSQKTEVPVYYFVARRASEQLLQPTGASSGNGDRYIGKKLRLVVEVTVANTEKEKNKLIQVGFPLSVTPRSPDVFRVLCTMDTSIRRIFSTNRSHAIHPYVQGKKAEVVLSISKENPIRLGDYVFVIVVELGVPVVPECADPVALLVLVTSVGMLVFFALTKDLVD